jgi:NAD(P)H-dependent flavin oxidoreductase YrpB (nitropropane dioxygenase family)
LHQGTLVVRRELTLRPQPPEQGTVCQAPGGLGWDGWFRQARQRLALENENSCPQGQIFGGLTSAARRRRILTRLAHLCEQYAL